VLAMLYNTSSSRYRSFNRIYPSIIARKYRSRNTFQRYSDTTVPHFTFFHQHPSRQKPQTSANTVVSLLPAFVSQPPALAPSIPTPAPSTPHPANQQTPSRPGSRLPISEFPGFLAAQILHKSQTSHNTATSYAYHDCVII
jgi:hypothetical protein